MGEGLRRVSSSRDRRAESRGKVVVFRVIRQRIDLLLPLF